MSMPKAKVQRTLFDVPVLVGGLFAATDRYRVFREKILPALVACREQLAGLYCADNGRPGIEPVLLAGVTPTPRALPDVRHQRRNRANRRAMAVRRAS